MTAEPERLAEVVPLAHARGMHALGTSDLEGMHAADDFDELVRPVGLKGPNRDLCRQAFAASPDGFRAAVADALARGVKPAAFLVHLVTSGDHLNGRRLDRAETPSTNRSGCEHPGCRYQNVCFEAST